MLLVCLYWFVLLLFLVPVVRFDNEYNMDQAKESKIFIFSNDEQISILLSRKAISTIFYLLP